MPEPKTDFVGAVLFVPLIILMLYIKKRVREGIGI
jgi:hypothetical protein